MGINVTVGDWLETACPSFVGETGSQRLAAPMILATTLIARQQRRTDVGTACNRSNTL